MRAPLPGQVAVDCWNCGGEGEIDGECICNSFEDVCCCAEPEPPPCRECRGTGTLWVNPEHPDAAPPGWPT